MQVLPKSVTTRFQTTIERPVRCEGIGLHKGRKVQLTLLPASANTGVIFHRLDVPLNTGIVSAHYGNVTETTLGTTVSNAHGTSVSTIEHLMAALWGMGVDNVRVELSGGEVPILDGSSEPFVDLIHQAGIVRLSELRQEIIVTRAVEVRDGHSFARIEPHGSFALSIEIEYPGRGIPRQQAHYDFSRVGFPDMLASARTFGFAADIERMHAVGLALGGSLDNAIVIGDDSILNKEGLRFEDEFVRHKALDCVGDFALLGLRLRGHVMTSRPGHALNNRLLRALMSNRSAWKIDTRLPIGDSIPARPVSHRPQPEYAAPAA